MQDERIQQALFWLNDCAGKQVSVVLHVEREGYAAQVVTAEGELQHWRSDAAAWQGHERADVVGLYVIGEGASIDLSDLPPNVEANAKVNELVLTLAEDVWLSVVVAGKPPLDLDSADAGSDWIKRDRKGADDAI